MAWFLLGAGLLALALFIARALVAADPRRLARLVRFGGAGLLGLLALLCLIAGRLPLVVPLAVAALLLLGRPLPFGLGGGGRGFSGMGGGAGGPRAGGQASEVETAWLRMRLDHDSGEIAGEVLQGRFAGRRLADLTPAELVELWRAIGTDDPQSARLVETYLDRHHGTDWRAAQAEPDGEGAQEGGGGGAQGSQGKMTRAEAYEVLGLAPGAGPEEVQAAYRRLMRNVHPDQGGSTWLAARINAARDVLLGGAARR